MPPIRTCVRQRKTYASRVDVSSEMLKKRKPNYHVEEKEKERQRPTYIERDNHIVVCKECGRDISTWVCLEESSHPAQQPIIISLIDNSLAVFFLLEVKRARIKRAQKRYIKSRAGAYKNKIMTISRLDNFLLFSCV